MKITPLLLAIVASCCSAVRDTEFSVHIKGTLLCHEKPYSKWPMDVYSEDKLFYYEDFSSRFTKDDGTVDLIASIKTDSYMITPYILIQHNCWETKQVPRRCLRKIIRPLTPEFVTVGSTTPAEKNVFEFGTIDLRFQNPYEKDSNCG